MSRFMGFLGTAALVVIATTATGCGSGGGVSVTGGSGLVGPAPPAPPPAPPPPPQPPGPAGNTTPVPPPPVVPAITAVVPAVGGTSGGQPVVLNGTNFQGVTAVTFGLAPVTITGQNATSVSVTVPAGAYAAGAVDVTLQSALGPATITGGYTFEPMQVTAPTPGTPASIPTGSAQSLVITGTAFKNLQTDGSSQPLAVSLQSQSGGPPVSLLNPTVSNGFATLTATVPAGSGLPVGLANLTVSSTSHGTVGPILGAVNFTAGPSTTFDIQTMTPSNGTVAGGTAIVCTYVNTGVGGVGSLSVAFVAPGFPSEFAGNVVNTATQISFTSPAGSVGFLGGQVNVVITSTVQGIAPTQPVFNYDPLVGPPVPYLTQFGPTSPTSGPQSGGTIITLQGANFLVGGVPNVQQVLIGGQTLQLAPITNSNTLTGTTPVTSVAGPATVLVYGPGGTVSPTQSVTFTYLPSLIAKSINPNQGNLAGGTPVTITGANFSATTVQQGTVKIGGVALSSVTVVNSSTVTGTTPAGVHVGPFDVTFDALGGFAGATLPQGFYYGNVFDVPRPNSAHVLGGTNALHVGAFVGALVSNEDAVVTDPAANAVWVIRDVASMSSSSPAAVKYDTTNITGGFPASPPIDVVIANMRGALGRDLVVLHANGTVSVLLQTAVGAFTLASNTVLGGIGASAPTSVDACDLDGDGRVDVAVAAGGAGVNGVTVLYGQAAAGALIQSSTTGNHTAFAGAGSWAPTGGTGCSSVFIVGQGSRAAMAGLTGQNLVGCSGTAPLVPSMNRTDVRADIVVTNQTSGTVSVLLSGDATADVYSWVSATACGTNPLSVLVADLNQDGSLDVVTGNAGPAPGNGNVSVLIGNGAGGLQQATSYVIPGAGVKDVRQLVLGDANYDCRTDVVLTDFNGAQVAIMLGNGDGTFADAVGYVAQNPAFVATAKITAIAPLLRSNGLGGVVCVDTGGAGATNSYVTVIPRHVVDLYIGQPSSTPLFTSAVTSDPQGIAFGDLSADGKMDVVVANRATSRLQVFIGDGNGNFVANAPFSTGGQPESVAIADFDGNGLADIVVACSNQDPAGQLGVSGPGAVAFHRNLGFNKQTSTLTMAAAVLIDIKATAPRQIVASQLRPGGAIDAVTVNQFSSSVSILQNDGLGGFTLVGGLPIQLGGNFPLGVYAEDVNGDGWVDLFTANSGSDDVSVLLSKGAAFPYQFTEAAVQLGGSIATTGPVQAGGGPTAFLRGGVQPHGLYVCDLNGDRISDIVTADAGTNSVTICHGKADGTLVVTGTAGVFNIGEIIRGPAIGLDAGFVLNGAFLYPPPNQITPFYWAVVTGVGPTVGGVTTLQIRNLVGGNIKRPGDTTTGTPSGPGGLMGWYVGDQVRGLTSAATGLVQTLSIRSNGQYFQPTDYVTDLTTVGAPPVVLAVGTNPQDVKLFDMNSDGRLDIITGNLGGSITVLINQGEATEAGFNGIEGLPQTFGNTPFFAIPEIESGTGFSQGGPYASVCPAGEFTMKAAANPPFSFGAHPSAIHTGYPIRSFNPPTVAPGADAKFSVTVAGHVQGLDVARVTVDCPPSVGVVSDDNNLRLFKAN